MPDIVNFDFDSVRQYQAGRPSRYSWDEWFDGKTRKFIYGVDFDNPSVNFQNMLNTNARKRGIKIRTRRIGNDIIAQALL